MRRLTASSLFVLMIATDQLPGQPAVSPAESATPVAKKQAENSREKAGPENLFGGKGRQTNEPITTQIYADEAFFDSTKNTGVFSGHVKINDPRFNVQSEKLTVFIS